MEILKSVYEMVRPFYTIFVVLMSLNVSLWVMKRHHYVFMIFRNWESFIDGHLADMPDDHVQAYKWKLYKHRLADEYLWINEKFGLLEKKGESRDDIY